MLTSAPQLHALTGSFRASPTSIHPIYTGGPVQLTRDGEWLVTTMSEEVLVTEVRTGRSVARIKGVSCYSNVGELY